MRIVVVEDQPLFRRGLIDLLNAEGFRVDGSAGTVREAMDVVAARMPDIVLMDLQLGAGIDGVEATRRIARQTDDVRIVILTMHADHEVLDEAFRAGAVGYLVKDCSTDEVASAVRLAADGETAMSPALAASMLDEVRRLDDADVPEDERTVTKREEEVLQLIADGCSTPEVAQRLFISQKTVKNHLASIYQKLDARDRTQAGLRAVRMGIIRLD